MRKSIGPACRFIDSGGEAIVGKENCVAASRRFFELEPAFRLTIDSAAVHGDEVLITGHASASDSRLAQDEQWRARIDRGKVVEWQSYSRHRPVRLAHILAGEEAVTIDS